MTFFVLNPRQDYAAYSYDEAGNNIEDPRIPGPYRLIAQHLEEYRGVPVRKPAKIGDLHMSGSLYFVRDRAYELMQCAAKGNCTTRPIVLPGSHDAQYVQAWVTNFVDCLDLEKTIASPSLNPKSGKIGVLKKPAFDEQKWDGSDLFVVPQDPNYRYFCTEKFVTDWQKANFRGAMFSRFLFDPEPIIS